ncbi:hydroxymethylpyrimidine/phosphomethylpyrimidine kinase [Mariniflexile sp. HNIBRBA6329]|uniref:hydroxymethylpyrimidine/phosphomethylpyrimidine kinase n=1 Tax=Mariniflexile sp. HNIBRBA6329 TaxID=3373088 RepID=UPI0037454EE3
MQPKPYIITIGGLDPSSGAGITSDIKTFETYGLYGLSVCTAVTVQDDASFKQCEWVRPQVVINQLEVLLNRFPVSVIKIGIVEHWKTLHNIIEKIKALKPEIKIIVDPILKASAGFDFHHKESINYFDNILDKCYLFTPNYNEIKGLYPEKSIEDTISYISKKSNIYLKGGHRTDKKGWDELYYGGIVQINIEPIADKIYEKHGSGCVLAAAIASNLVKNMHLEDACRQAKYYTEQFLNSNTSLLGHHNYQNT